MLKHITIVGAILFTVFSFSPNTIAEAEPLPELTIPQLVDKYSTEYGVSRTQMWATMKCENTELDPTLQSRIINNKGEREESYGIAQIHLPSHPEITKAQATDAEFSVKWMAKEFKAGRANQWTCARKLGFS